MFSLTTSKCVVEKSQKVWLPISHWFAKFCQIANVKENAMFVSVLFSNGRWNFFFQLMVSLSSDKNCHVCEMTATAKNAQECYFSLINLSVVWINWFSCDKIYWLPSLWNDKNNKCSRVPFFYEQCECDVNKIDFLAIDCIRNHCVFPSLQVSSCSSKRVWHLHKQEEWSHYRTNLVVEGKHNRMTSKA